VSAAMLGRMIEVGPSQVHGRGVFATAPAAPGDVLEACPALPLSPDDARRLSHTVLDEYVFDWGDGIVAIGFGALSLCNHADPWNAEVVVTEDPPTLSLVATAPIAAGEEVLIDYGPDHRVG
jgi:SET domain-containing protein